MKKTGFFKRVILLAVLSLFLPLLTACNNSVQVAQLPELGCPVYDSVQMQRIFRGVYGVDGMSRPLNDHGVPVDVNGYCLTSYPVTEVYNAPVAAPYQTLLFNRWHYTYFYNPAIIVAPVMPGLYVHPMGVMPGGRVMIQTTRPALGGVTTGGAYGTVRPGVNTTVAPGGVGTVRPGAINSFNTPANNLNTVRPGYSPTQTQRGPVLQPQTRAPTYVQPNAPAGAGSMFNRPQTTPRSVMPMRPTGGISSSFNRPSISGGRRR